jgi:hypothetical protein
MRFGNNKKIQANGQKIEQMQEYASFQEKFLLFWLGNRQNQVFNQILDFFVAVDHGSGNEVKKLQKNQSKRPTGSKKCWNMPFLKENFCSSGSLTSRTWFGKQKQKQAIHMKIVFATKISNWRNIIKFPSNQT